jgi:arabinogalactan endo-1,4-beta-galactosidase
VGFYCVVSPDAWEAFAVEQNLKAGYFYFDCYKKVKQYTGADRVCWVGIGYSASQPSVNPISQFKLFKKPPRLSGKESRGVRSFSKKVMLMLELYNQATTEDA